jgi:hypothetical protein
MVRMLLVLTLIVAAVASPGFYLGWFHFSSGSDDNNAHVTVSVDKGQIRKDKAADKVQDARDRVATTIQQSRD